MVKFWKLAGLVGTVLVGWCQRGIYLLRRDLSFCESVPGVSQIRILTVHVLGVFKEAGKVHYLPCCLKYLWFSLFINKNECHVLIGTQDLISVS